MDLAYCVFVSSKLRSQASDGLGRLDRFDRLSVEHAAVPNLNVPLDTSGGDCPGLVFIPVEGKKLGVSSADRQESIALYPRRWQGLPDVHNLQLSVHAARSKYAGIMRGPLHLVYTCIVGVYRVNGLRALGGPLRGERDQKSRVTVDSINPRTTHDFNRTVPRCRGKEPFFKVRPAH